MEKIKKINENLEKLSYQEKNIPEDVFILFRKTFVQFLNRLEHNLGNDVDDIVGDDFLIDLTEIMRDEIELRF